MATTLEGKGLAIGPMDPDNAGDLTKRLGVHNKATKLLKQHAANWPEQLTRVLALPRDNERSDALDLDEVESALLDLRGRRAFFSEEDHLEDASVRGEERGALGRWVTVVFTLPSGRTSYGALPYDTDGAFAATERRYDEKKASDEGRPVALEAQFEGGVDEAKQAALETAARQAEEAAAQAKAEADAAREELERLRDPEPWDGYDEANADAIKERIAEGGSREFGTLGLERIYDYEERHKNRKGVLEAVSDAIDAANAEAAKE